LLDELAGVRVGLTNANHLIAKRLKIFVSDFVALGDIRSLLMPVIAVSFDSDDGAIAFEKRFSLVMLR